jgi:hypothetical protein
VAEVQKMIAQNPSAFKELAKKAPSIQAVNAERRTGLDPKLAGEPRDES